PGAPTWGLPPPTTPMIWQGLTDAQICRSIKNPKENKNRNIDQLVEHLTQDKLVAWGWNPGEGRTPIPMPHEEFSAKVKQWQAAGAPCPTDTGKRAKLHVPGQRTPANSQWAYLTEQQYGRLVGVLTGLPAAASSNA